MILKFYILAGIGFALLFLVLSDKKAFNSDNRILAIALVMVAVAYPIIFLAAVYMAVKRTLKRLDDKDEETIRDLNKKP